MPPQLAIAFRSLVPVSERRASTTLPAGTMSSSSTRASMILLSSISAARVSPIPRSISHSGNLISCGLQQHARFGERQSDDVRVTAGDVPHIDLAIALERIASRLAAPFAMAAVIIDFFSGEPLHRDHRLDQPFAHGLPWNRQRDTRQHAMAPAGEQLHARSQRRFVLDL